VANYLKQVAARGAFELIPFDACTVLRVIRTRSLEIVTLIEVVTGLINFCDGRVALRNRRGL